MKLSSMIAISLCYCLSASAFSQTKADAKTIYETDTKKIRSGDLNFDWKEYRLAAVQGGTASFDWHPVRTKFMQQMDKGDAETALKIANDIINHNMAEAEGHLLALVALQKLGRQQDADFQHKIIDAYVHSILSSGDGKSSQTAFVVVSVDEEYFYLHIVLGVGLPASQALITRDGHSYDLLKIKGEDGKEQELWFNVDISMNDLADAMDGSKKKK